MYPIFFNVTHFWKIKNWCKVCGDVTIISDLITFLVESSAPKPVCMRHNIIIIFYMTIECNDIYKTAKLSLFCKVIVFRTNDYDLSTVAFKYIIKTEPFFLGGVLNETAPSAKRRYPPPLPHLHLVFAVFLYFYTQPWFVHRTFLLRWLKPPDRDAIRTVNNVYLVTIIPVRLYSSADSDATHNKYDIITIISFSGHVYSHSRLQQIRVIR